MLKQTHPIVLIVIDADSDNLRSVPSGAAFAPKVRKFSDQLREKNIPTIFVTFPKGNTEFRLLPRMQNWSQDKAPPRNTKELEATKLHDVAVRMDEDIFFKGKENAFMGATLTALLLQYKTKKVLLCGGVAGVCIPATAAGAVKSGFEVSVVSDMLFSADSTLSTPEKYKAVVQTALKNETNGVKKKVSYTSQSQLLNGFKPQKNQTLAKSSSAASPAL